MKLERLEPEEREAVRAVKPAERYLRLDNTNHDGFAAAMAACEGYAPSCSDQGCCQRDGDCFSPDPCWRAVRRIERLARDEEHSGIARGLRRAACLLSAELKGVEAPAPDVAYLE